MSAPRAQDRVCLKHAVDIYPLGVFPAGLTGTVVDVDPTSIVVFHVRLDQHFDCLNPWNNRLQIGRSGSDEVAVTVDDLAVCARISVAQRIRRTLGITR